MTSEENPRASKDLSPTAFRSLQADNKQQLHSTCYSEQPSVQFSGMTTSVLKFYHKAFVVLFCHKSYDTLELS